MTELIDLGIEGGTLITEGSTYAGRHFLRNLDAENAKDLRRRPAGTAGVRGPGGRLEHGILLPS